MQDREKVVAWALRMTENTPIAPDWYEQQLLAQFVRGVLTLDQVLERLENSREALQRNPEEQA